MLTQLRIRDFVTVVALELDLSAGMSAVTGETGAGKSILIDALGLLLGDRADSAVIRHGAAHTDISAVFEISARPAAQAWLAERDLYHEPECHLRRVISQQGRSRNYINGIPQPAQALRQLGAYLVEIHGQHEHQSLLQREAQRQLLDAYAGHSALAAQLAEHYRAWSRLGQELRALRKASSERDARLEILRYHLQELDALNLLAGEILQLETEQRRLAHASQLLESCQLLLNQLSEADTHAVADQLTSALRELAGLERLDARLRPLGELLNAALIQVQEASAELRDYVQSLDLDPAHLVQVEQRLTAAHHLARKHKLDVTELPALRTRLAAELHALEHSETRLDSLQQELQAARSAYHQVAEQLSVQRAVAAQEFGERITAALASLGMPHGQFAVLLETLDKPTVGGMESVEFQVSANPGQPLRPLAKVASGGELSRISLAIQVLAAHTTGVPTLVFDEVDSGIGGAVAEVVGRELRTLGQQRQVLCVTHLPQVAAQAHQQFKVEKHSFAHSTHTEVTCLEPDARVVEIARMLGGVELTAQSLAHAREMLGQAPST